MKSKINKISEFEEVIRFLFQNTKKALKSSAAGQMAEIRIIYEESHEINGAPKIAAKMVRKSDKVSGGNTGSAQPRIVISAVN